MSGIVREEQIGPCRLIQGNCLELLHLLSGVDALVTDPPYGIKNEFGTHIGAPGHGNRTMQFSWDDASSVREAVMGAARGVGAAFVFCGFDTVDLVQSALRDAGLTPKPYVWVKSYPPPALPGTWWPSGFELAIYAYRSGAWFGDKNANRRNVYVGDTLRAGNSEKVGHDTQKPLHIMEYIVRSVAKPNGLVADLYMGSNTTGVACIKMSRKFIGFEVDSDYFALACERTHKAYGEWKTAIPFEDEEPIKKCASLIKGFDL